MPTYSKNKLSQSARGNSIVVSLSDTTQLGTLIHTTQPSLTSIDEVWLYGCNPTNVDAILTITMGGSSINSDCVFDGVLEAYSGNVLLIPGMILTGDDTVGSSIYAWATPVAAANIFGYVNRIS